MQIFCTFENVHTFSTTHYLGNENDDLEYGEYSQLQKNPRNFEKFDDY